ncbi:MAG TPA: type 4a pilus biogenesis protein PilO [Gemmatimonadaceae bacterium]
MALLPQEPRKQYMLLAIIVAVASAALYWNFVWSPKGAELATLTARLDTLDANNAVARTRIARGTAEELEAEAEQASRDLEVMRQLVPTGNELPALLEQVSTAARREGLDISGVEPQPVVEGDTFDTYRYKLTITGGYHALAEFLTNVGSLTRIVAPVNLTLSLSTNQNSNAVRLAPTGTAAIESKFDIQTYVIRSAPLARGGKS